MAEIQRCGKTRGPVLPTGVTAKQEAFARAVIIEGMNLSDAFRASHCAEGMAPATIWRKASALAKKGKVRARCNGLRAELDARYYENARHVRSLVIERLHHEALTACQASARIRALELLGKLDHVQMFRYKRMVDTVPERSADEIACELRSKLLSLLDADAE